MVNPIRLTIVLLTLIFMAAASTTRGADINKQYKLRIFDNLETCVALNYAVHAAKKEDDWGALHGFSLYLMGYLNGINRLAFDTYDIGGKKNTKTLMVWLQSYCAANPEVSLDSALHQLIVEIYPTRSTVAPQ